MNSYLLNSINKVDIYDGDQEPVIYHGKSFTSKVSLREVCEAILKYGFVASPYPIIISAEIHCSIGQQDLIAGIMMQVFGEKLVRTPLMMNGEGGGSEKEPTAATRKGLTVMTNGKEMEIEELPSPEQLKGRILLKVSDKKPFINDLNNNNNVRPRIWSYSRLIHWIVKVPLTRILHHLLRIRMLSINLNPLTKVMFTYFSCRSPLDPYKKNFKQINY